MADRITGGERGREDRLTDRIGLGVLTRLVRQRLTGLGGRWSSADLATEAITRGFAETISPATMRRWLTADAIKPWQRA